MKVTAILPDELIAEVQKLSNGKNTTEALKIALDDWTKMKRLKELNVHVRNNPLALEHAAEYIRSINRQ